MSVPTFGRWPRPDLGKAFQPDEAKRLAMLEKEYEARVFLNKLRRKCAAPAFPFITERHNNEAQGVCHE